MKNLIGTTPSWPYFFDEADYHAIQTESPVPVFTCWNGIAVFTADPLLPIALRSNRTLSNDPLPYDLPSIHPAAHNASMRGPSPALTPPIQFRASAPEECYSSESFLLPYDLRRQFNLKRIFVNSRVINGYQWRYVTCNIITARVLTYCLSRLDTMSTSSGLCVTLWSGGGSKRCTMAHGWRELCSLWAMQVVCTGGMEGTAIRDGHEFWFMYLAHWSSSYSEARDQGCESCLIDNISS